MVSPHLLFRFNPQLRRADGVFWISGGGPRSVSDAISRVFRESRSRTKFSTETGGFGRNFISDYSTKKYSSSIPISDYRVLTSTSFRNRPLLEKRNLRSISTQASVNEQEVQKTFELYLSSVPHETIPRKEIYSIYIEGLCTSSDVRAASYLLSHLHDKGVYPRLNTYNILMSAATKAKDFILFSEIFKYLLLSKQPPDSTSYVHIAEAFHNVNNTNLLLKFIVDVSSATVHRDPTVINRIIFATAKSGQIDRCMMMFEELKNLDHKIDKVTFNTVIAMLGVTGRVDQMLSEFKLMKDLGHIPDIVTYNTLINSLRRLGRLDLCKDFAREMIEGGIELDLRTYTALIDAFGRTGHVEDALEIFDEMKKSHRPSIYVYRALISDLKKSGKFEKALSLREEMNSDSSKLVGPEDFRRRRKCRRINELE